MKLNKENIQTHTLMKTWYTSAEALHQSEKKMNYSINWCLLNWKSRWKVLIWSNLPSKIWKTRVSFIYLKVSESTNVAKSGNTKILKRREIQICDWPVFMIPFLYLLQRHFPDASGSISIWGSEQPLQAPHRSWKNKSRSSGPIDVEAF